MPLNDRDIESVGDMAQAIRYILNFEAPLPLLPARNEP